MYPTIVERIRKKKMTSEQIEALIEKLVLKAPKIKTNETEAYKRAVMRMALEAAFSETKN